MEWEKLVIRDGVSGPVEYTGMAFVLDELAKDDGGEEVHDIHFRRVAGQEAADFSAVLDHLFP